MKVLFIFIGIVLFPFFSFGYNNPHLNDFNRTMNQVQRQQNFQAQQNAFQNQKFETFYQQQLPSMVRGDLVQKQNNQLKNYYEEQRRRSSEAIERQREENLRGYRHQQLINTMQYGQPYGKPHNTQKMFQFDGN